jgi:hypothetical protein
MKLGYRHSDRLCPVLPELTPGTKFGLTKGWRETTRSVVGVSLGIHLNNFALPHPDINDAGNALAAALKRMAIKALPKDPDVWRDFMIYQDNFNVENFVPLSPDTDFSFEAWILEKDYPEWRKEELRVLHAQIAKFSLDQKMTLVKCFIKDETYPEFKFPRGIYSRSDMFKVLFGPIVAAVEKVLYKHPAFVKKVPVKDRPEYISMILMHSLQKIAATDITSMEASFDEVKMEVNTKFFRYMLQNIPSSWYQLIFSTPAGLNHCVFKYFWMDIMARRMSGEMDTSCSNGYDNLLEINFVCEYSGLGKARCVVEGDDALFVTESGELPDESLYTKIGSRVKLERHTSFSEASFCGIIFDPIDKINVTDPRVVIAEMGWASHRYKNCNSSTLAMLLRCKGLSYLHQYYGCPIIQSMALYALRLTKGRDISRFVEKDRSMGTWVRAKLKSALAKQDEVDLINGRDIPINTRMLVEKKYGIPILIQLKMEAHFNGLNTMQPFDDPYTPYPIEWSQYFDRYVVYHKDGYVYQQPINDIELFGALHEAGLAMDGVMV